jgi:hypothetical protein
MSIPILEGRDFDNRDTRETVRVAIVSDALARRLWPGTSAVGRQLKVGAPDSPSPWATIIGVVGNVRAAAIQQQPDYDVYFSYRQVIAGELYFVIRSSRAAAETIDAVTATVQRVNPGAAVFRTLLLEDLVTEALWQQRLWAAAVVVFAILACTIAAASVYAVVTTFASQRRRELAIRAALGAARRDLLRIVGRESVRIISAGSIVGLTAGVGAVRIASASIAGLSAPALPDVAGAIGVALLVFGLATLPAIRSAARTDPATLLRSE